MILVILWSSCLAFSYKIPNKLRTEPLGAQVSNPFILAEKEDARVTKMTILIELAGMSMAATNGDNRPWVANPNPTILYKMDKMKLSVTIGLPDLAKRSKRPNWPILLPWRMASQAGEKRLVSSETAMPASLCCKAPASFNPSPSISTFFP